MVAEDTFGGIKQG